MENSETAVATCAVAIMSDDAPEWIELIPAGKFSAVDGRGPFENSDPDSIVAASIARMPQVGLVLDYDHSTDLAAPEGRPAPAAGWLKEFKVERGAIFARIEWTVDAAEAVKAKKYRYVSPVFEHGKDGKVERILRAALTNNPALINLPAIASALFDADRLSSRSHFELCTIVRRGSQWYVYTDDGKRKLAGPFDTRGEALERLRAIEYYKHQDDRLESLSSLKEGTAAMAQYAYTDADGKGHLPIHDAAHVRNALARFGQTHFESRAKAETAWGHIKAAAKKFGIEVGDEKMPTVKIKEPSSGYKKSSAEESGEIAIMARKEGDGKPKLSEIMEAMEKVHPGASHRALMEAAARLVADDDGSDGDGDGKSFEDWAEEEEHEPEHAGAGAEDPYERETAEEMAARHQEEMTRCSTDAERSETATRHSAEKERFMKRMAETKERNRGLEHKSEQSQKKGEKSLASKNDRLESLSHAIARHPMVIQMARNLDEMRAEAAKAQATEKVDAAIRDGRLVPSQREWAIAYCTAEPGGFAKFLGTQPKILQSGPDGTFTGRIGVDDRLESLSHRELMVCEGLGITAEKFVAAKRTRLSYNVHLE